ncbi:hypothetical protein GQ54DRAFT_132876 [Martensiomyces pterosporus]|nr:hypothetical protein GQ54DRAFT_132876 [Martensiomyces pterosporus]
MALDAPPTPHPIVFTLLLLSSATMHTHCLVWLDRQTSSSTTRRSRSLQRLQPQWWGPQKGLFCGVCISAFRRGAGNVSSHQSPLQHTNKAPGEVPAYARGICSRSRCAVWNRDHALQTTPPVPAGYSPIAYMLAQRCSLVRDPIATSPVYFHPTCKRDQPLTFCKKQHTSHRIHFCVSWLCILGLASIARSCCLPRIPPSSAEYTSCLSTYWPLKTGDCCACWRFCCCPEIRQA